MESRIRTGEATVLTTHTVTTFAGAGLVIELEHARFPVRVVLDFVVDADRGVAVDVEWLPNGVRLVLTNLVEGRGSARPFLIGQVGPDLLYLHFRVFRYGDTPDHTVHYTIYSVPAEPEP